ncbi:MAG TPA: ParA family protein [Azospirillaceae bacterium]|nr:ParA family protein [Azospirillaceae bacterium]
MPVVTVASTKGGTAKTTLALCLADWWRHANLTVECLDIDPNRNLSAWIGRCELPITCQSVGEDDVVFAAVEAARRSDMVVIDVAGSLARGMLYAIGAADAVLIPCKPSANDALEAARTRQQIMTAIAAAQKRAPNAHIPHAVVLTQVNRRASVTANTVDQLRVLGVPLLGNSAGPVDMPHRTAYQQASYRGSPLDDPAVREDMGVIVSAVEQLIETCHG